MSLKQLGNSYLVGASDTAPSPIPADPAQYRGNKDVLVWLPSNNPNQKAVITVLNGGTVNAKVFRCSNLLDDPGTFIGIEGSATVTEDDPDPTITLRFSPTGPTPTGLFRVQIRPESNLPYFKIDLQNVPWYALECIEPSNNFYVWGAAEGDPVTQYFFAPKLPDGETVRVRLQGRDGIDKARMQVYKEDGTEVADFHTNGGTDADAVNPFFATYEMSGDKLPENGPGEIYKFVLTRESDAPTRGPSGNTWVRFSRNVPPYFANDPKRLIYPIVHKEFEPVIYASVSGASAPTPKRQTYRAYLTVPRGQAGTPSNGKLMVNVNDTVAYGLDPQYDASISLSVPFDSGKIEGSDVQAQLLDANNRLLADSTDKVDTVYVAKNGSIRILQRENVST